MKLHKEIIPVVFGVIEQPIITIKLKRDTVVLDIQLQDNQLVMWYSFYDNASSMLDKQIQILVGTTGNSFICPYNFKYIKTIQWDLYAIHLWAKGL